MVMALHTGPWTVDMVRELPDDGNRYECMDGVLLVTPALAWLHQWALDALQERLTPFVRGTACGVLVRSPAAVRLGTGALVQPDLFVIPMEEGRRPAGEGDVSRLVLAVEVLSATTAARDRGEKRRLYQRFADEYWIVDLDARMVERWRPGDARPEVVDEVLVWQPAGTAHPLRIELGELFREVWEG